MHTHLSHLYISPSLAIFLSPFLYISSQHISQSLVDLFMIRFEAVAQVATGMFQKDI